jgi:8-oxo-dGTP diphosphatase
LLDTLSLREGKYLLTRRSAANVYRPLVWDVPGGTVAPGETVEGAVAREVREETKLEVEVGGAIYIYSNLSQLPERQTCQAIYACKYSSGDVQLNPSEHDKYEWLSREELNNVEAIEFLKEFLDKRLLYGILQRSWAAWHSSDHL